MVFFLIFAALPLINEWKKFRPDVIHCHFGIPTGPLAFLLNLLFKTPYIITLHGGDVPGFIKVTKPYFALLKSFVHMIYSRAYRVVCVSPYLMRLTKSPLKLDNLTYISNGVDLNDWANDKQRENVPEKTIELLFVGRFVFQKGLDTLLAACSKLKEAGVPFHLTMIGDGEELKGINVFIDAHRLTNEVTLTGWLSHAEIKEYMDRGHIFIFPSRFEAFPTTTFLQAMANGLPILASKVRDIELCLKNESALFNPGDAEDLVRKIITVYHDKEKMRELSKTNLMTAHAFGWESVAQQYIEIFKNSQRKIRAQEP